MSETSSREKHLANFFKTFGLKCFDGWNWQLSGGLLQSWKTRVLHSFQFSSDFQFSLELFMTIHFLSQLKLTQTLHVTLYKLHFCIISTQNPQEKGMGSHFLAQYFLLAIRDGLVIRCWVLFVYGLLRLLVYVNLFRLLDLFIIIYFTLCLGFVDWFIPISFELTLFSWFKMIEYCLLGYIDLILC